MRESTCNWRERDLETEKEPWQKDSGVGVLHRGVGREKQCDGCEQVRRRFCFEAHSPIRV